MINSGLKGLNVLMAMLQKVELALFDIPRENVLMLYIVRCNDVKHAKGVVKIECWIT